MIVNRKRRIIILSVLLAVILALVIWTVWGNTALQINQYTISSDMLPSAFDGYRIAHISDLHNTEIGNNNDKLISMLKDTQPDIIAITGDMIDSRNTNVDIALKFAERAVQIAPCYYVSGNHEARVSGAYESLKAGLNELGVIILENRQTTLEKSGETVSLLGVMDPRFLPNHLLTDSETTIDTALKEIKTDDNFSVLLSHRPELFDVYVKHKVNLVLSGHAHGGQFRLPFIGGLMAPNQGIFPKYDSGLYTEDRTNMIVSRGIGNSLFPFRFNNRPEIVLIELRENND